LHKQNNDQLLEKGYKTELFESVQLTYLNFQLYYLKNNNFY